MSEKKFSLEELFAIVKNKINSQEKNSYSAKLAAEGLERITRKVGEEALEVVIAAFLNDKNSNEKNRQDLIGEVADLFFHTLILLAATDIGFEEIISELHRRNKTHE